MMLRARERAGALRADLAAAAWRPERLRRWCLAHDDEFALPTRPVRVLDGFLSPEACDALARHADRPVCLVRGAVAASARAALAEALEKSQELAGPLRMSSENVVQIGDTRAGTHEHRDNGYQGGAATLLVYLCDASGRTVFPGEPLAVRPLKGRAVLFDVRELHRGEPCAEPKLILAVEMDERGIDTRIDSF
jgi:hypothetical protein